jgi:hypothetical protein
VTSDSVRSNNDGFPMQSGCLFAAAQPVASADVGLRPTRGTRSPTRATTHGDARPQPTPRR